MNKAKPQHEQKEIQFRNKHQHTQTTKHQTVVYVHARLCVGYSIYIGRDSVAGSHTFYSGEREQKDRNLKKKFVQNVLLRINAYVKMVQSQQQTMLITCLVMAW